MHPSSSTIYNSQDREDVVHKYTSNAICSNTDGQRDYHTKRSKEKFHMTSFICRIVKKMIQMNLLTEEKKTHRQKTNLWLPMGKGEGDG